MLVDLLIINHHDKILIIVLNHGIGFAWSNCLAKYEYAARKTEWEKHCDDKIQI